MTLEPDDTRFIQDIQELQTKVASIEDVIMRITEHQKSSQAAFDSLIQEYHSKFGEVKNSLHKAIEDVEKCGLNPLPDIPINDPKLKQAWMKLYNHHEGANADTISDEMNKHRTTVSTYLNILVHLGFARKEREGHQTIYFASQKEL